MPLPRRKPMLPLVLVLVLVLQRQARVDGLGKRDAVAAGVIDHHTLTPPPAMQAAASVGIG